PFEVFSRTRPDACARTLRTALRSRAPRRRRTRRCLPCRASFTALPEGPGRPDLSRQPAIFDAMRLIGGRAQAAFLVGFVVLIVALEPDHLAVAFEREH